jgi:hypothetical protein
MTASGRLNSEAIRPALVLPEVIVGIMDASTMRSALSCPTRKRGSDYASRSREAPICGCRPMENRGSHQLVRSGKLFVGLVLQSGKIFFRLIGCECRHCYNATSQAQGISGNFAILVG